MSSTQATTTNRQYRLARRPSGMPVREDWSFTTEAVGDAEEGGVLVKTLALSLDPAMRGWMNEGKSYIAPVGIGEVMRAGGIGTVIASKSPAFATGDTVYGTLGVQEFARFDAGQIAKRALQRIDLRIGTMTQWLNVLGMPGMTGYFGLLDVGQPKPGETVVVSGAAGAVGQTVGQLAKIKGCRAVGIAGGPAKCEWVVKELGFDACIDYKAGPVKDGLKAHCPAGVDIYFDNVGGEILETCLPQMVIGGRVACCGSVSTYDGPAPAAGPRGLPGLLVTRRLTMSGFLVSDFNAHRDRALADLRGWVEGGLIKVPEHITEGLETLPAALVGLLAGENFGKRMVKVA
jgi:NADPH-dependent curcumin reductase